MTEAAPGQTYGIANTTQYLQPFTVVKTQDETRTNTAAVAQDRELIAPINPGAVMHWKATLFFYAVVAQAGNADVQWTTPAAPTNGGLLAEYLDIAVVNQQLVFPQVAVAYNAPTYQILTNAANGLFTARFEGMLINGANGGYFSLSWAQNVVNAAPTVLVRGSRLDCWFL
jgi:hypothetical protein